MINEEVQTLVNRLINIEHYSSTLYLAMAAYLDRRNYVGMASWLRLQAEEERGHMVTLINYLTGKDGTVKLEAMPAQPTDFGTPLETFQKVLAHEEYVTNAYRQAYDYIIKRDPQTAVIVNDFLREQIDEEAQSNTIVQRLKLAGNESSALLLIDQELGRRNGGGGAPAAVPPVG